MGNLPRRHSDPYFDTSRNPSGFGSGRSRWRRSPARIIWLGCSLGALLYSMLVITHVAQMGTIGVRCMFGTKVEEEIHPDYAWSGGRPRKGDELLAIGGDAISEGTYAGYADYIRAMRKLSPRDQIGKVIEVRWRDRDTRAIQTARVTVRRPPAATYLWSWVWFAQELLIFLIGALVYWKRPNDESAKLFFVLCIVTVGAFMGGYHWTEIVVEPFLIYLFALFAVFLPVVILHFYLVFPRAHPILARHRRLVLGMLYGGSSAYLLALWGSMRWAGALAQRHHPMTTSLFGFVRTLALGYVGLATLMFGLCILCLVYSYRHAETRAERNQVRWILLASVISLFLIAYLLVQAWNDPATLGRDSAAWPMFAVSLLFTMAHAFSITRYKLMQVEGIINRSAVYFAVSLSNGLVYSGMLLVGGKLIGDRLFSAQSTTQGAIVAAFSTFVVLPLLEVAHGRFQRVIDRQFFGEKYKFDEAMHKMRLAVESLVHRETLSRRLLAVVAEVLRLEWGALYLGEASGRSFHLVASHGPMPEEQALSGENPLVVRLRETPTVRLSHALVPSGGSDPASDAMIALGGEAATALESDGRLAGLLVLGPKRSGMPYEDEEMSFLGGLSSVATLVLHSADIQETLESLNHELRDKVEKIAEQQRRILILQDQLRERAERDWPPEGSGKGAPAGEGEPAIEAAGESGAGVFQAIRGSGSAVRTMLSTARKVAASPSAVLIRGESGTGKELLAAAIHQASPRAARPFVKVHCAALSQSLLESELFGHVKGAFTGADRDRVGRFEQAHGGTLFLDEIGDINLEVQTKLLRVLQEMSFERVGSSQPISVDVRILAATHQDLETLIQTGRFREDLYYRLNVICLYVPALRERREDIFELALHFLKLHAQRSGKFVTHLDPEAVEALAAYDWPGNIRELENVLERAVVLADGPAITREDLPPELRQASRRGLRPRLPVSRTAPGSAAPVAGRRGPAAPSPARSPGHAAGRDATGAWTASDAGVAIGEDWNAEFVSYERQRLIDALHEAQGNKSIAARLLGLPRSTFFSKLKKHGIA